MYYFLCTIRAADYKCSAAGKIAVRENNIELCNRLLMQQRCVAEYALAKKEYSVCEEFRYDEDALIQKVESERCYYELAILAHDPTLCEKIVSPMNRRPDDDWYRSCKERSAEDSPR